MHKLTVIGRWMSQYRCYLDLPRDEAIARWRASEDDNDPLGEGTVREFNFHDEFEAYSVWPSVGGYIGEGE